MSEPPRQQMGDGSDNYGQAAGQMAKAAKQAGKEAAKQAAAKGAEATANAATATVQASVEGGKAVAEVAAGTAAGGPWGAILSAAWALRHTLYKILICICLVLVFLIVVVVNLPAIIFGKTPESSGTNAPNTNSLMTSYTHMADSVSAVVDSGYDQSLAKVEQIINDGGYDYDLSMEALINYAQSSSGYDVSYILAAYSAAQGQQNTSESDMIAKLTAVSGSMFPVTSVEQEKEILVPVTYNTYKSVTVTVVTRITYVGSVNGVAKYSYTTESRTYYLPEEAHESETAVTVDAYKAISVTVPVYANGRITGTSTSTYYEPNGTETLEPTKESVKFVECTIHPFDNTVIASAFGIDLSAQYQGFNTTYGQAIQSMANGLKMTLYGTLGQGQAVPLTDAELIFFVNRQNVNTTRKHILTTALSLVGKVPYVWDSIKTDITKKKAIFIDEIWKLIGETATGSAAASNQAAEFCLTLFKTARGFGTAAIAATQDLSDFFSLEGGKYGRAIINNSKNKVILNLEPDEAKYVQDILKLTPTEMRAITRFERGEALINSNNNKVPVVIKASREEQELITTDRAELEAILRERQRKKAYSG